MANWSPLISWEIGQGQTLISDLIFSNLLFISSSFPLDIFVSYMSSKVFIVE